jgi:hypothetical protein
LAWQFGVGFDLIGHGSPQDIFDAQLDVRTALLQGAQYLRELGQRQLHRFPVVFLFAQGAKHDIRWIGHVGVA